MKKKLLAGLALGVMMFGVVGAASATILNFDDLEGADSTVLSPYTNQGYQLTTTSGGFATWNQGDSSYNTSASLFNNYWGGVTRLSAVDGSLFNLTSIDLDTVFDDNGPSPVVFFGYNSANQQIGNESLMLSVDGWTTFTFSTAFTSLSYVEWAQDEGGNQFDNIVINGSAPVPEPATMLLFGTGLAGLIGVGRRRKK